MAATPSENIPAPVGAGLSDRDLALDGASSAVASVVVVGSANADIIVRTARHPAPGETVLGSSVGVQPGGKGLNQAVAAARAGATTTMIARLGNDANATLLRDCLTADGVDVSLVGNCKHESSGTALIIVDGAGENSIVVVAAANSLLRKEHVSDGASKLASAKVVLAQLEVPIDVVEHAFGLAKESGQATTILNAAPATLLGESMLDLVDVLLVNEHELLEVAGEKDFETALATMAQSCRWVVVTLGAEGARAVSVGNDVVIAAHQVDVVDTTGAGDSFAGSFASAIARGADVPEAMRFANAGGALATKRLGATASLPSLKEVRELMDSQPRNLTQQ